MDNLISKEQLAFAAKIFVMENKHLKAIKEVLSNKYHNNPLCILINSVNSRPEKNFYQAVGMT
ncbi:hypothetical protein [uncultured Polaribacter sp.]|uniref:hypothetical protein n=1 Tax=uncultured Polaribacter sp. TaxID=174711 RepID=UPI00260F077F|nr:hypothetical protein [uncultured Polaribacter sp.]